MHVVQYDVPLPSNGGMCTQIYEKIGAKMQTEEMTKVAKLERPKTTVGIVKLIDKTKCSEGSRMDQAKLLDVLLNQSTKVLNKNHDTEETDASIISK